MYLQSFCLFVWVEATNLSNQQTKAFEGFKHSSIWARPYPLPRCISRGEGRHPPTSGSLMGALLPACGTRNRHWHNHAPQSNIGNITLHYRCKAVLIVPRYLNPDVYYVFVSSNIRIQLEAKPGKALSRPSTIPPIRGECHGIIVAPSCSGHWGPGPALSL